MSRRYAVIFPDGSMSIMAEPKTGHEAARYRGMAKEERDGWNERERRTKSKAFAKLATVEVSDFKVLR